MKTYIVNIQTRKNDDDHILGPYCSFEQARKEAAEEQGISLDEWKEYSKYNSSFEKGTYYTEEYGIEIYERTLK